MATRKVPKDVRGRTYPILFGKRIARREYVWRPAKGRGRKVILEIGTPAKVGPGEWACRVRIKGLPLKVDQAAHGVDAIQALELALVCAGKRLSESPEFLAGQIEQFGERVRHPARLFLPLPMTSLQMGLENLRGFLERKPSGDQNYQEWRTRDARGS